MDTMTMDRIRELRGSPVVDANGDKLGTVEQIYFDVRSETPQWIGLRGGMLGSRNTFVPLEGAVIDGNTIQVPVAKEHVESSPDVFPDAISSHAEEALYQHYGMTRPHQEQAGYGQPAQYGQPEQYGEPAQPTREPLKARLVRWEWEARQR